MPTHWTDEHAVMIEDCEIRESRLSEWEREFIASIKHQLNLKGRLSPKQIQTLDDVWERATARG